jgi:hypothetical protein
MPPPDRVEVAMRNAVSEEKGEQETQALINKPSINWWIVNQNHHICDGFSIKTTIQLTVF